MRTIVADLLIIAGMALVAVGCGIAWLPAGLVIAGIELSGVGLLSAWAFGRSKGDQK